MKNVLTNTNDLFRKAANTGKANKTELEQMVQCYQEVLHQYLIINEFIADKDIRSEYKLQRITDIVNDR